MAELRSSPPDERAALVADLKDNAVAQALADHLPHPRLEQLLRAVRAGQSPESAARAFVAYNRPSAVRAAAALLELAAEPPGLAFYTGTPSAATWRLLAKDALLNAGGADWEPSGPARYRHGPADADHAGAVVRFGLRLCVRCAAEYPTRYPRRSGGAWYCSRCPVDAASHAALRDGMHDVLERQARALGVA